MFACALYMALGCGRWGSLPDRQLRYGAQVTTSLYDSIGGRYRDYRRPDRRIAAVLSRGLAGARAIVNIGAGVGSYEPRDRDVVAVEPSRVMISQRVGCTHPLVQARPEALPFRDDTF